MGVIYKLSDEVVNFIISQRQSNPLFSCRQLAEAATQKFGIRLSKSSVHDVLKASGIMTPRGRKPKDKFQIPEEKKKQIQVSLSQAKFMPPVISDPEHLATDIVLLEGPQVAAEAVSLKKEEIQVTPEDYEEIKEAPLTEKSGVYEEAGKIFLKAALWDLGIFSQEDIKENDWGYYLTYTAGMKVTVENTQSFFIDSVLPLQRAIREAADGLINNVVPLIVHKVSNEALFKASMEGRTGFKMTNISIVDQKDHILCDFNDIMELNRKYILTNRIFVESNKNYTKERLKDLFFTQSIDNDNVIEEILNLKGFDILKEGEINVNLIIQSGYSNKILLEQAAKTLNGMYVHDEQNRSIKLTLAEEKN